MSTHKVKDIVKFLQTSTCNREAIIGNERKTFKSVRPIVLRFKESLQVNGCEHGVGDVILRSVAVAISTYQPQNAIGLIELNVGGSELLKESSIYNIEFHRSGAVIIQIENGDV